LRSCPTTRACRRSPWPTPSCKVNLSLLSSMPDNAPQPTRTASTPAGR
jgi:hypothetical protein